MADRELNFGADASDADYQIRDDDPNGGDLIIEHTPSGATFEYDASANAWVPTDPIGTSARPVPGIEAESVTTELLKNKNLAISARTRDAVVVAELDDPVYPINDYSDTFDAVNTALSDLKSDRQSGSTIYIPNSTNGTETINSGKISIPAFSNGSVKLQGLGGVGKAVSFQTGNSFPDDVMIDEKDSGTGSNIANIALRDINNKISNELIRIRNAKATLQDLFLSRCGSAIGINIDGPGEDSVRLSRIDVREVENIGIRSTGNFTHAENLDIKGNGVVNSTGIKLSSGQNYIHGDIYNVDVGVEATAGDFLVRFEGPGNSVPTPYKIDGADGINIIGVGGERDARYRQHSEISGLNISWASDLFDEWGGLNFHQPLASEPSSANRFGELANITAGGAVELRGTNGSDAGIDLSGSSLFANDARAPMFEFGVDDTQSGAKVRAGFVESKWDDWAGLYYDASGSATWRLRSVEGGSVNTDVDSGIPGDVEGSVFLNDDNYVGLAVDRYSSGATSAVKASASDTRGTGLAGAEPMLFLDNDSGADRLFTYYYTKTTAGEVIV
jgi:hypothetical protein